jgi:hypothetical protein
MHCLALLTLRSLASDPTQHDLRRQHKHKREPGRLLPQNRTISNQP